MAGAGLAAALVAALSIAPGRPATAGGGGDRPEPLSPYSEELVVHEVGLVVDLPRQATPPSLASLLVREEGQPRQVVKVERLAPAQGRGRAPGASPWDLVLYFDRFLADPEAEERAAISLARSAEALTDLGGVEVVVADPQPHELLAATREPMLLEETLSTLAGRASRAQPEHPGMRSAAELRRQADRLVAFLAARDEPLPRALFLVAGTRVAVTPRDMELLSGAAGVARSGPPPPPTPLSLAVLEAGQVLAAYGWITCPVTGARRVPGEVTFFRPQLAPIRALARLTAGQLVDDGRQVGWLLQQLRSRSLLWYQTSVPRDGRVRPIEVWLEGRTKLAAPRWVLSGTPRAVSEARLRNALAGDDGPSPWPLAVRSRVVPGGLAVELRLRPPGGSAGRAAGPVRLSFAYIEAAQGEVRFDHVEEAAGLDGALWTWRGVVPVREPRGQLAVEVEDLGLGVRATAAIAVPSPTGGAQAPLAAGR
jgi:hypothetical protein